jgi:hypothetical protein
MYNIYIQYIPYKAPKPSFFRTKYVRPFFSTPAPQMRAFTSKHGEKKLGILRVYIT